MSGATVHFIDSGDTYFWYCRSCDHSRKLDVDLFREKFGPEHGALSADIVLRLRCTRGKNLDIGLTRQAEATNLRPVRVNRHPGIGGPPIRGRVSMAHRPSRKRCCVYRLDAKGDIIVPLGAKLGVARKAWRLEASESGSTLSAAQEGLGRERLVRSLGPYPVDTGGGTSK